MTAGEDWDVAATAPVERIARVLAAHDLSKNADGDMHSAGEAVNAHWPDYTPVALAILRTLREPSGRMAAAGDAAVWERMIAAAIDDETIAEN
ncbi:hypothetical protein [Sphingopyxis sp.]|uniref:hypothetical protein n=1 Tax=Sphingopyxis sp. TaxID=1908224 RepID=UPI002D778FDB|nr:hypothetical protein [Sphingopyxis sp.]HET6526847.1 hypothetical protein [Sphingopyxis sp.]